MDFLKWSLEGLIVQANCMYGISCKYYAISKAQSQYWVTLAILNPVEMIYSPFQNLIVLITFNIIACVFR